jgi:hypothetical protein
MLVRGVGGNLKFFSPLEISINSYWNDRNATSGFSAVKSEVFISKDIVALLHWGRIKPKPVSVLIQWPIPS